MELLKCVHAWGPTPEVVIIGQAELRLTRTEKEQRAKTEPQGTPKARVEKKIENEASFTEVEEKPGK